MEEENRALSLSSIESYYSDKITRYGATPQGVDWNGYESQSIRFNQLLKLFPENKSLTFSVADIGCGYAAFHRSIADMYASCEYIGCDVSPKMVSAANASLYGASKAKAILGCEPPTNVDYSVASGIFSVKLDWGNGAWRRHILESLDRIDRFSDKGFAFNCLTSYSDAHLLRDHLYYADPLEMFDECKTRYSRNVSLLHDYDLFEFTILVRK